MTPFVDFDFINYPEIRPQFGRPLIGGIDLVTMFSNDPETTALVTFLAEAEAGEVLVSNVAGRISPNRSVDLNAYMSEVDRAAAELLVNADEFLFDLDDQLPHEVQTYVWSALMDFVAHQDQVATILQGIEAKATEVQGPSDVSGELNVGIGGDVTGLDPARLTDANSWMVTDQIYDTLIDFNGPNGFTPSPGLAESWSVSPDGLTWTFQLRPGVQFHDGTDLDAAAVDYNFQRWWDPAHPDHTGDFVYFEYLFGGYKGDPGSLISATNTIWPLQFQLILSQQNSQLPSILMHPALAIASPAVIQTGILITEPVGTGPFTFAESLPDDIILAANTDYWGPGPQLDALTFQIIPDDGDRYAALETDLIQVASQLPSSYSTPAGSNPDLSVPWHPALNTGYLGINRSHGPLGELKVRQAIAHAIDKQELIDLAYTEGDLVSKDLLPPDIWGSDPAIVDYAYNPQLSQQLLTEAGYPGGFSTTLPIRDIYRQYLPDPVLASSIVQGFLHDVGIDAEVVIYESGEFINLAFSGQLDLFLLGWIEDYPHPANFYYQHFCDFWVAYGPKDNTLCGLLDAAAQETDFFAQLVLYQSASNHIHDTLPMVPLAHGQDPLITRSNVTGIRFTPFNGVDFAEVNYLSDGSVQSNVLLQGRADNSGAVISAWDGGTPVDTRTTAASGIYTLTVPPATYTVTYEMARYLDSGFTGVDVSPGSTVILPEVTLRCGDTNDDDVVNILDLALMGGRYTLICGDPGWDERADINDDCVVNILDLSCAGGNYGSESTLLEFP